MSKAKSTIVGRRDELRLLDGRLEQVADGAGECVFVCGDLGIGKTLLAHEAAERARGRGFSVLQARAWSFDAGLAYAPIIEALGPTLRGLDSATRSSLVDGLSDLGRLLPWLVPPSRPISDEPALEKTRLFEAVSLLVERLGKRSPLLLIIDDLHAADDSTLELFHYLMRSVPQVPLLALCTVRSVEARASPQVRRLMGSLERAGIAHTLELAPLSVDDIRALAADELKATPSRELVELLRSRTHGVALFVTALLTHLAQTDALSQIGGQWFPGPAAQRAVPPSLWQLFEETLSGLDPAPRELVELLAVAGEPVPHTILEAACKLEPDAMLQAISELRRRGLVLEHEADAVSYEVAHPLGREVLYDGLNAVTRRAHHRALLGARERLAPRDLTRLARHYRGVGIDIDDPERAVDVLVRAATQARNRHAHREAAQWLSAALPLIRAGTAYASLPKILEDLGECYATTGEVPTALELWEEAVALYERHDDLAAAGQLRSVMVRRAFEVGRPKDAERLLAAGISALEPAGPSAALARLYWAGINMATRRGDFEAASRLIAALDEPGWGEVAPDVRYEAHLAAAYGAFVRAFSAAPGDPWWTHLADGRGEMAHALACAQTVGQRLRASQLVAGSAEIVGECEAAIRCVDDIEPILEALDDPAWRSTFANLRARVAMARARLPEAMTWVTRAAAAGRRAAGVRALCIAQATRAEALAHTGELAAAEEALAVAMGEHDLIRSVDRHVTEAICTARATVALQRRAFADGLEALAPMGDDHPAFRVRLLRSELLVRSGATGAFRAMLESLAAAPEPSYPSAAASRILGLAHRADQDGDAARRAFDRAIEQFSTLGMPLEVARTRLERADGVPEATREAIDDAAASLEVFRTVGARLDVDRARAVLRRFGVRLAPERRTTHEDPLSAREREVAELAASGLTNAAVAKRLFLSPHTIASHLKRIYARLGVSSRNELARWLTEHQSD